MSIFILEKPVFSNDKTKEPTSDTDLEVRGDEEQFDADLPPAKGKYGFFLMNDYSKCLIIYII